MADRAWRTLSWTSREWRSIAKTRTTGECHNTVTHCSRLHAPIPISSDLTTRKPLWRKRKTSQRNRSHLSLIRSTHSHQTIFSCSIFKRTTWLKWNRRWTTSLRRLWFIKRRSLVARSACSLPTRSRHDNTRSWRRQTQRSRSSTFASRLITRSWMTLVMECTSARSSKTNAPRAKFQSNQRIHLFRRRQRNHRRLRKWELFEPVLVLRSSATLALWENPAAVSIAHLQLSCRHKCHPTTLPTTQWVTQDAKTATIPIVGPATVHCQCHRASRSRCT